MNSVDCDWTYCCISATSYEACHNLRDNPDSKSVPRTDDPSALYTWIILFMCVCFDRVVDGGGGPGLTLQIASSNWPWNKNCMWHREKWQKHDRTRRNSSRDMREFRTTTRLQFITHNNTLCHGFWTAYKDRLVSTRFIIHDAFNVHLLAEMVWLKVFGLGCSRVNVCAMLSTK